MQEKSKVAEREEKILKFWQDNKIFEKTLKKPAPKGDFVFYEGPPTANGKPGIHHLEARAFKDVIPRYKTMRGYRVRRKGGWDTHGLPVELQVEKELGLKSKKEIEKYGIAAFNKKCRESVWRYMDLWGKFTDRIGYWVDQKNPYVTYEPDYIESLWSIIKHVDRHKLLYKDYKVVPWCPRCGTALSSHELAQGYKDVHDLSLYVKFRLKAETDCFLLAWTTTPWTLPGNVALAVNPSIEYVKVKLDSGDKLILAKARLRVLSIGYEVVEEFKGSDLVGVSYEPLYPFITDSVSATEKGKLANAYKVYAAGFVTTEDGTGIVHTAVMYGQDDFELGVKVGLPKHHLVGEDGIFKSETEFLAGKFVKDEATEVLILKDLATRTLLFKKEKYSHSYPHCWRCHTPLIYFARDSWYIKMSALRDELVRENKSINWKPEYIKEGRFGEWLKEVKDWAFSRERYWGTPLPVWVCDKCGKREVLGSYAEVRAKTGRGNKYFVMRHGEADNNVLEIVSCKKDNPHHLTMKGKEQVVTAANKLKNKKIDLIVASPFLRTQETAKIVAEIVGYPEKNIVTDARLGESDMGEFNLKPVSEYVASFKSFEERFERPSWGGENYANIRRRVGEFLYETDKKYLSKNILIITHHAPAWLLFAAAGGLNLKKSVSMREAEDLYIKNAEIKELRFAALPHNAEFELDPHRPYVDEISWDCVCGGKFKRVKEVVDVWFDSGAMPFAQDHFPFENRKLLKHNYPADFISEAIDQTRGWFYTLHAVGVLLGKGRAYKNVISLGLLLDAKGKKMSKSLGNVVDPWEQADKFGVDALRYWMYSVNQPGDFKNYDEKTVDEISKKVFNLLANVEAFYAMYSDDLPHRTDERGTSHVLDRWLLALRDKLVEEVSIGLDNYNLFDSTRAIKDFIADFSQWYIRRSRERFKGGSESDKKAALHTTQTVLLDLAKLIAPFAPFFAESLYKQVGGKLESVHLEDWPQADSGPWWDFWGGKEKRKGELIAHMAETRRLVSLALEARAKAGIKVRQPLGKLVIKSTLSSEFLELIRDEVNVKEIIVDPTLADSISLDTTISPELLAEGKVREFIRSIQELRKKFGLHPKDSVILEVGSQGDDQTLLKKFRNEIMKGVSAHDIKSIQFTEATTVVDGLAYTVRFRH